MRSDCHIHMVLDGSDWRAAIARHREKPEDGAIAQVLGTYQGLGFRYLRDGGDRWGVGRRAKELAPGYGIAYRTPCAPLCRAGHYGGFIGKTFSDLSEYRARIRENKNDGADFVKIMISGLMDFDHYGVLSEPGLGEEEIGELIRIAHGEGFAVMAHANGAKTVLAAAKAGVDSIEHGAYLNEEALCAMRDAGTVWVPTLSAIGNLRGKGRFCQEAVEKILASAQENVAMFAAMGGLLAPGTDAGAWAVPHGSLTEYALLEEALGAQAETLLQKGTDVIRERF